MARRIKGINVEIGGDTRPLAKSLKEISKTSEELQGELKDVNKLLKFDPKNTELLAQKQELLTQEIENTSKKLNTLKDAEAQVQEQFKKGKISAEVYRNFQRELQDTQKSLEMTEDSLAGLIKEQERTENATKTLKTLIEVTGDSLEDYAHVIGDKLVTSIKRGSASSRDIQKAIDKIGREAMGGKGDINELRKEIGKIDSGEASINKVRKSLNKLGEDAEDATGKVEGLADKLGGLTGAVTAGVGAGAVISKSLDIASLDTTIDITFKIPEESKAVVKGAIKDIEAYGVDAESALEGVRRQWVLNGDAGDAANERVVKGAGAIVRAYNGIDFTELIQETNEIASELGITNEEALGLTTALLDVGFPPEQLDIISEYGGQLKRAGYTAEDIQGVFAAGIETKTWNIDNLLDGLKEGRIKLEEFGVEVDDATATILEGTEISSQQLQQWGKDVSAGGEQGKKAMEEVALALVGIKDETKRNEVGVALFGTMWEEQGLKITDTILNANEHTGDLAANTQLVKDTVGQVESDPITQLKTAFNDLLTALTPVLEPIAQLVGKIAAWMEQNPQLAATITAVVVALGIFAGIVTVVIALVAGLTFAFGALFAPVTIAIAIIAALIAIGVALWVNWETIKKKAGELADKIKTKFNEFKENISKKMTEAWEKIQDIWDDVMGFFKDIDLKQIGKDIIQGLIDGITDMVGKVKKAAENVANGIGNKVKEILKLGSPSKLLKGMGEDTGEGLKIGLENTISRINKASKDMAAAAMPKMHEMEGLELSGTNINRGGAGIAAGKQLTVNMYSPKALDVREANIQFKRTLNKMAVMW